MSNVKRGEQNVKEGDRLLQGFRYISKYNLEESLDKVKNSSSFLAGIGEWAYELGYLTVGQLETVTDKLFKVVFKSNEFLKYLGYKHTNQITQKLIEGGVEYAFLQVDSYRRVFNLISALKLFLTEDDMARINQAYQNSQKGYLDFETCYQMMLQDKERLPLMGKEGVNQFKQQEEEKPEETTPIEANPSTDNQEEVTTQKSEVSPLKEDTTFSELFIKFLAYDAALETFDDNTGNWEVEDLFLTIFQDLSQKYRKNLTESSSDRDPKELLFLSKKIVEIESIIKGLEG